MARHGRINLRLGLQLHKNKVNHTEALPTKTSDTGIINALKKYRRACMGNDPIIIYIVLGLLFKKMYPESFDSRRLANQRPVLLLARI